MTTPHKHAEIIKAWADGAEIEGRQDSTQPWKVWREPAWNRDFEYRIKPAAPVVETNYSSEELYRISTEGNLKTGLAMKKVANAAIARAIADGQVVPVVADPNNGMLRETLVSCYFEHPFTVHGYTNQIKILKDFMSKYDELVGLRDKRDMAVAKAVQDAIFNSSTLCRTDEHLAAIIAMVK